MKPLINELRNILRRQVLLTNFYIPNSPFTRMKRAQRDLMITKFTKYSNALVSSINTSIPKQKPMNGFIATLKLPKKP